MPRSPTPDAAARQVAGLRETDHRPWPLPRGPWVMGQTWVDLLFAHWRLPPEVLRPLVPRQLALDLRDGEAWIGVTPFEVLGLRARGLPPVPYVSRFPELNVRTYVTVGDRPGIHFLSLDAARLAGVVGARMLYRLPYFHARMAIEREVGWISYRSRRVASRPTRELVARYRPTGPPAPAAPGSLEAFLAERYCLYTVTLGRVARAEIHPPPWPLQPAEAAIAANTMLPVAPPTQQPLLHLAARQDVVVWPLTPVR